MRKLLIPLLVLISSFIFISKPKAYSYNDVTFYIDGKEITDSFQYINFDINTTGLDTTVNLMGIDTAGTYYVRLEFCSRSWDNYIFDNKDFNYTITNEVCELNSTTTGLKRILDIKFVTWNGITPGYISTYGISSKLVPHNAKSDRFAFKMLNFTVFNSSEYNQVKEQDKTNEKLDNINNSITDETPPDTSEFGNVAGWLPAGPVDSIITLPLNVLNSISNALNGKCSTINLPLPFIDSTLPLTCGTEFYSQVSGLSLFLNTLFTVLGGVTLYKYFVYLYNWVDKIVSLKENDEKWGAV